MALHQSWLYGLCVLALAVAASDRGASDELASCVEGDCSSDFEESSALQRHLKRGLANNSATRQQSQRLVGLQPQTSAEETEEIGPLSSAPCLAQRLAGAPLAGLAAVLLSACWSLVARAVGSGYRDVPSEATGTVAAAVSKNLCMAFLWLALHSVVAAYATYISNGVVAALAITLLCLGATVFETFVEPAVSKLTDKGIVFPEITTSASQTMLLQMATILFLLAGRLEGLEIAWLLSLLGMGPAVYFAYEITWSPVLCTARWAAIAGQAIVLITLTRAYAKYSKSLCEWGTDPLDAAANPELSVAIAVFVVFVFGLYSVTSGKPKRRVAFLSMMALIASPGLSALTGQVVLYGPWGMFAGSHEGHRLTSAGYAIFACGALLVALMCRYSQDVLGLDWDSSGQRPSLALVRILLPFWLLRSSHWGYSMPFLEWHYPGDGLWGGRIGPALLISALMSLAFGVCSHVGALVAATGFFFGLARLEFDTDSPVRCVTMLLLIAAYTPCDGCFSLVRHRDASLWAKSLFRLHMSFLYFFAALFKVQGDWLKPDGGTLYKDIHLLQTSPLKELLLFFLRTEGSLRAATTALAWSTMAVELLLAFALWRKSWHVSAVIAAALIHLAMSFLCGELGGFTQAAWIGLIGSLEHEPFEKFLSNTRNFAVTTGSIIFVMALVGFAF